MAGIIGDIVAVGTLVEKAVSFAAALRNDWYANSDELAAFPNKIERLSLKYAQWSDLVRRSGMPEDKGLKSLAKQAVEMIDQEKKYVEKIKRSKFLAFRRKAFPGKLNGIVDRLLDIVDAGPQFLETRVANIELLDKVAAKTPNLLPYSPDDKYVPVSDCVAAVRNSLQDENGKRVVTVHGVAGIGKSSLAKYVSLNYQEGGKWASSSIFQSYFPDGVFYLFCGKGADVKQMQLELLRSLGCAPGPSDSTDSTVTVEQEEMLKKRLQEQKSLIIIDDLWERKVLRKLVPGSLYVRYLVTAQIRTIWSDAEMIELKAPSMEEAKNIMANYTEGLPIKGNFPESVQEATDAIIRRLDYHPLSLANAGLAINRSRATDPDAWKQAEKSIRDEEFDDEELDEDELEEPRSSPMVYETPYPRTLGASMMLMVNNLRPDSRHLLFLVTLLMGNLKEVREDFVKYILKRIEPDLPRSKYDTVFKELEDRSLVTLHTSVTDDSITLHTTGTDDFATFHTRVTNDFLDWNRNTTSTSTFLAVHGLRAHFIKKKYTGELRSIVDQIYPQNGGAPVDVTPPDDVAPIFHSLGSYTIHVRIIQTELRARYNIVEKTINADGTWTEPSQVDGEQTLTMGSSGNSGMLRFANPQGDYFLVALGVQDNKRWCDIVVDANSSDTGMKIHPTYDSEERGEMLWKQLAKIQKTSSKRVYIKVDYYKEDGRTHWATITISSPIFHSPRSPAMSYTTHVSVIHTKPCARYSIVEKTVWYYANGGTWSNPGGVDGEQTLSMGGSGTSGTLRFANPEGDYFLVALGVHNYKRWFDIVVDMDSSDTGVQIHPTYYGGGQRNGTESWGPLARTSSKSVCIKLDYSEDGNTCVVTITIS